MRVFVAGATGVIGRRLLPLLTSQGHEVIGLARSYGAAVEVELRGADNTLARRTLDWAPRYSSWRQGFAAAALVPPTFRWFPVLPIIGNHKGSKSADEWWCQSVAAGQAWKYIDALEGADYEH
jgi:uncharacterized protein YbjT (DUF2867 family)